MKRALKYAHLQLKRAIRHAPFVFLITLVLCLCLGLLFVMLNQSKASSQNNKKLRIGIVGEISESYLGFGVSAIQSLDSSRFMLELEEMDEESAKSELADGNLVGYVVIPEGFVEEAMRGRVGKLTFVSTDSAIDMVTVFKQEVLEFISCLLVESQNGVYAAGEIVVDLELRSVGASNVMDELMMEYVMLIFNRSNATALEIIGVSDSLSFAGYMFSGITVFLLLLCGISCASLFIKRDMALQKLMNANRCSSFAQVLGEYSAFFLIMCANVVAMMLILLLGARDVFSLIPECSKMATVDIIILVIRFIPAIIAISALQFLLFELSSSIVSGVLMQFVCAVGLAYVSGCFYPISFFPKGIQALSVFTPSGIARKYLSEIIFGGDAVASFFALIVYAMALLLVAVAVRRYRIKTS